MNRISAITAALAVLFGAFALVLGLSANPTVDIPEEQRESIRADETALIAWATDRYDCRLRCDDIDRRHPHVAFRRDLADALLPVADRIDLPPVSEWRDRRLALRAEGEQAQRDWYLLEGSPDPWEGWDRPDGLPYMGRSLTPQGEWWEGLHERGTEWMSDTARYDAVEQNPGDPYVLADYLNAEYPVFEAPPITVREPVGQRRAAAVLGTLSGLLAIGAVAGAVVAYRRRNGASA